LLAMIITCPSCTTRYIVEPQTIGADGRRVRCSNCGQVWLQTPVAETAAPAGMTYPGMAYPSMAYPGMAYPGAMHPNMVPPGMVPPGMIPPGMAQPGAAYPAMAAPAAAAAPAPAPVEPAQPAPPPPIPEDLPPEPQPPELLEDEAPLPPPPPEPEPEPEPVEAEPIGDEVGTEEIAEKEKEDEPLSQDDLDALFDADSEPEAVTSVMDEPAAPDDLDDLDEKEPADELEPEDLPEPEPIPAVFSEAEEVEVTGKGGVNRAVLSTVIVFAVLAVLAAGLILGRTTVVSMVPATERIYALVGLGSVLGAGLEFRDVASRYEREGDVNVLVVHGVVANVTNESLSVPLVRVSVVDASGQEVHAEVVPADQAALTAGAEAAFEARFENPSATMRRAFATFTRPDGPS